MDSLNFSNKLDLLLKDLRILMSVDADNICYDYLIKKMSQLSIENIKAQKDSLTHFIVDSYDGDMDMGNRIIQFCNSYNTKL